VRAVVQRVKQACVTVDGEIVASIDAGLLVLLGVQMDDSEEDAEWLSQKIVQLRLFSSEDAVWQKNVAEIGGKILVVSQFTLFASTKKGTKPSWHRAAKPEFAAQMCENFTAKLEALLPSRTATGRFGMMMDVALVNDGPVTLIIDSKLRD
jgi:D-aminoacyl-tRNA deacylase